MNLKFSFLFLWLLVTQLASTRECNLKLLRYFNLRGSKYPMSSEMNICPNVVENCCLPEDELKIGTLWNEFSTMKIDRRVSLVFKHYNAILEAHQELINVDTSLIEVIRRTPKTIPYKFKICERTTMLEDLMDPQFSQIDLLNHNKILDLPGFDARKLKQGSFKIPGKLSKYNSEKRPKHTKKKYFRRQRARRLKSSQEKRRTKKSNKNVNLVQISQNKSRKTQEEEDEPNYEREFVFEEELPRRSMHCRTTTKEIHKEIVTENNFKHQYCMGLQDKLINFRIDDFQDYIIDIKTLMLKVIRTKQTFYCALCDNSLQKFIKPEVKTVTFDREFCRKLVWDYKEYLKFQNIIFVEYVDLVVQYIRCFQTTAEEKVFPYPNFLDAFRHQFQYIERCFTHIDNENFMEHCIYVCDKYSYTSFSSFWDGNIDFLTKVMFLITSFLRKVDTKQALTIDYQGIKDELEKLEKVDFDDPFYAKDKDSRKLGKTLKNRDFDKEQEEKDAEAKFMIDKMKEMSKPGLEYREIEEGENSQIYEMQEGMCAVKVFRNSFVADTAAIDPIFLITKTNFGVDAIEALEHKCDADRNKHGPLDQDAVIEYFSFSAEDIHHFQKDLFLSFADYSLFEEEEINTI